MRAQERILRDAGVDVDAELAVFEASYGSPRRAVRWGAGRGRARPSVRSADALGLALTRAGQPARPARAGRTARSRWLARSARPATTPGMAATGRAGLRSPSAGWRRARVPRWRSTRRARTGAGGAG